MRKIGQTLAIFDLDGTITERDTMIEFYKFCFGKGYTYLYFFFIIPLIVLERLKILDNQLLKEWTLSFFFWNKKETWIRQMGERFAQNKIEAMVRKEMQDRLDWHEKEGHEILIITASCELWLSAWIRDTSYSLISSKMAFKNGEFQGRLIGRNCHGKEKVIRLKETYDLKIFQKIYAYGDSSSDKYYMDLAHEQVNDFPPMKYL